MNRFTGEGGSGPGSTGPPPGPGLARYGSAPGSLLAGIAESVIRGESQQRVGGGGGGGAGLGRPSRFFPGESMASAGPTASSMASPDSGAAYGSGELHAASPAKWAPSLPLVRHSSSPAGVLSHLIADVDHHHHLSMTTTRGIGNYSQAGSDAVHAMANSRLRSQWSFSRQDSGLSQISEMSIPEIGESGNSSDEATGHAGQSYISSNLLGASWEDTNSIMFSPPGKRGKESNGDVITSLSNFDSQFGMPKTAAEFADMEKYLQMHQDSVACKVRAKRGCATHPRSIAERVCYNRSGVSFLKFFY